MTGATAGVTAEDVSQDTDHRPSRTEVPNPWAADRYQSVDQLVPGRPRNIYFRCISESEQTFILKNLLF